MRDPTPSPSPSERLTRRSDSDSEHSEQDPSVSRTDIDPSIAASPPRSTAIMSTPDPSIVSMQERLLRMEERQTSFMDEIRHLLSTTATQSGPQPSAIPTGHASSESFHPSALAAGGATLPVEPEETTTGRPSITRPQLPGGGDATAPGVATPAAGPAEQAPGNSAPEPAPHASPVAAAASYAPSAQGLGGPPVSRYSMPPEARYDTRFNRITAGPATTANARFAEPLGTPFVPYGQPPSAYAPQHGAYPFTQPSVFGYAGGPTAPARPSNPDIKPLQPKQEDVGDLDPASPESFILRLRANMARFADQEDNVVACVHRTMVQSKSLPVSAWYSTLMALDAGGNMAVRERLRSVEGWIDLINFKFSRSMIQRAQALQAIRFDWNEPLDTFCAKIIHACVEAGKPSEDQYIVEICSRLPPEFLNGLAPGRFTSVAELERELRINEAYVRRIHFRAYGDRNSSSWSNRTNAKKPDEATTDTNKDKDKKTTSSFRPYNRFYDNRRSGENRVHFGHTEFDDGERMAIAEEPEPERVHAVSESPYGSPTTNDSGHGDSPRDDLQAWYFAVDEPSVSYHTQPATDSTVYTAPNEAPNILTCRPSGPSSLEPGGYLNYSIVQMPVSTTPNGEVFWRLVDTGAGMSLASRKWLDSQTTAKLESLTTPVSLTGVVPNHKVLIKHTAKVDLYVPINAVTPTRVHVVVLCYVVDSLVPGLLLGPDFLVPYKVQLDLDARTFTLNSCTPRVSGTLKCTPSRNAKLSQKQTVLVNTSTADERSPFAHVQAVHAMTNTKLEPGHTTRVTAKFPAACPPTVFFDGVVLDDDGQVRSANSVIDTSANFVLISNFSTSPYHVGPGDTLGFVSSFDDEDVVESCEGEPMRVD